MIAPFKISDPISDAFVGKTMNSRDFFSIYMNLMNPHLRINTYSHTEFTKYDISEKRADQIRDRIFRSLGDRL